PFRRTTMPAIDEFSLTTVPIDLYFNEQSLSKGTAFTWERDNKHFSSPTGTTSQAVTRILTTISRPHWRSRTFCVECSTQKGRTSATSTRALFASVRTQVK